MKALKALLVIALVTATITATTDADASGIDQQLCRHDAARVSVPSTFFLDACFDGTTLTTMNRSEFIIDVMPAGDWGDANRFTRDASTASLIMALVAPGPLILPPGHGTRIRVGAGGMSLNLEESELNDPEYPIIKTVDTFLPLPVSIESYNATTGLYYEIDTVTTEYHQCLARNGLLGDIGCSAQMGWDVSYAGGRFATRIGIAFGKELLSMLTGVVETAAWANAAVGNAIQWRDAARSLSVASLQPSGAGPSSTSRPASGSSSTSSPTQTKGTVSASGRQGPCQFGPDCLIASFSISGFSPHPGSYICVFSDGTRSPFQFSGTSVNPACYTADTRDWIEIEINGVRSNRLTRALATTTTRTPTSTRSTATVTSSTTVRPTNGTVNASGRQGSCQFGANCLIASFSISGFSPHPGTYTCVFSDGFRASFAFSGSTVNTACYTADPGDWIEIEINGTRSNRVTPAAPPTTTRATRTISAVGRRGSCQFGANCLIASFSISGFSPHPGTYTCVFSDGFRASFAFSGSTVNTACYTADPGDWIEIEINGTRSNRVS